jgi:hypothetical protein
MDRTIFIVYLRFERHAEKATSSSMRDENKMSDPSLGFMTNHGFGLAGFSPERLRHFWAPRVQRVSWFARTKSCNLRAGLLTATVGIAFIVRTPDAFAQPSAQMVEATIEKVTRVGAPIKYSISFTNASGTEIRITQLASYIHINDSRGRPVGTSIGHSQMRVLKPVEPGQTLSLSATLLQSGYHLASGKYTFQVSIPVDGGRTASSKATTIIVSP